MLNDLTKIENRQIISSRPCFELFDLFWLGSHLIGACAEGRSLLTTWAQQKMISPVFWQPGEVIFLIIFGCMTERAKPIAVNSIFLSSSPRADIKTNLLKFWFISLGDLSAHCAKIFVGGIFTCQSSVSFDVRSRVINDVKTCQNIFVNSIECRGLPFVLSFNKLSSSCCTTKRRR